MTDQTDTEVATVHLSIHTLRDALGIGIELADEFGPDPFCAVWIGDPTGALVDLLVLTDDRGRDIDGLVDCLRLTASGYRSADRVVLWRWSPEIADAPALAEDFFWRRDRLDGTGLELLDEIVLFEDDLRSMAVTTFSERPDWDDVTALIIGDGAG